MNVFFSAPRKINLEWTVNRYSGSPTALKNVLNKNCKIKHAVSKWKTSVIILQDSVFDETCYLILRD